MWHRLYTFCAFHFSLYLPDVAEIVGRDIRGSSRHKHTLQWSQRSHTHTCYTHATHTHMLHTHMLHTYATHTCYTHTCYTHMLHTHTCYTHTCYTHTHATHTCISWSPTCALRSFKGKCAFCRSCGDSLAECAHAACCSSRAWSSAAVVGRLKRACVCTHVWCVYVCACVCARVRACMYELCTCLCMYVCTCVRVVCSCAYVCLYKCVHVCMYELCVRLCIRACVWVLVCYAACVCPAPPWTKAVHRGTCCSEALDL